jgi:exopolysaccharide/PEP-CTERM locus tyrosine autokinase
MSKIAKALEKAKQNRGEEPVERMEAPVSGPMTENPPIDCFGAPVIPPYSQTKIMGLDMKVLTKHRVLSSIEDEGVVDAYNIMRTQILQRTKEKGWNTIMVTSVLPGEGKTLTSINLAVSLAREVQQTALLVDVNFRNPKISNYLGMDPKIPGLAEYLLDDKPVCDILVNPGVDKMVVLPAGRNIPGAVDILSAPKLRDLVRDLKTRYPDRYVIYDCPHILDMPDSLVFSTYVDAVVLVVEAGRTPKSALKKALKLLEGRNIIGTVMNKAA